MANLEVMTVTGPISADKIGVTSMHEHIFADSSFSENDFNKKYDNIDLMTEEIRYFREAGGNTIVEQTSRGLGQDIAALYRISKKSGVQIVAATGFYRECVYPHYVYLEDEKKLAKRLIADIQYGIDDTGIRPGIIAEIATEFERSDLSLAEKKVFRAAAWACLETGLAVATHCWEGSKAFKQIKTLTDEGVKPDRILIGHLACSRECKVEKISKVADTGVYLGIDTIGYTFDNFNDDNRADIVKRLIDKGYLRQITISQDMMRVSLLKRFGGIGYGYMLNVFIPMLKERGITEDEINVMLVQTPYKILGNEKKE